MIFPRQLFFGAFFDIGIAMESKQRRNVPQNHFAAMFLLPTPPHFLSPPPKKANIFLLVVDVFFFRSTKTETRLEHKHEPPRLCFFDLRNFSAFSFASSQRILENFYSKNAFDNINSSR
jgi:hypothetical protein